MVAALYAKLYWTLLVSFCVMGLCLAFVQPLFSAPDEDLHWQTAHYRLEHLFGAEGCVPTLQGGRCSRYGGPCAAMPKRTFVCRNDTVTYGGVLTYPGVLLSKLLLPRQTESGVRQAQAVMLGRLLQGLLVLLCPVRAGVVAIRAQRRGALVLGAFMISPLVAQQSFAISSDCSQIGFGASLFVVVVAWERLGWLDLFLFVLFGFSATAKPTALPCILPALFAGFWFAAQLREPSASAWQVLKELGASLKPRRSPSVQSWLLWSGLALTLLTIVFSLHLDATNRAAEPPTASRVANQAALLDDPWLLVDLTLNQRHNPLKASSWVGPLGWLDTVLAPAIANAFMRIMLIMLALELTSLVWQLVQERPSMRSMLQRLGRALPALGVGLLGALVNVVFVCAVMYVLWADGGAPEPEGTQFRYFFPAVMMCIALFMRSLDALAREPSAPLSLPASLASPRRFLALSVALQCLVLSLSLPLVSRVFVDLAERYNDKRAAR